VGKIVRSTATISYSDPVRHLIILGLPGPEKEALFERPKGIATVDELRAHRVIRVEHVPHMLRLTHHHCELNDDVSPFALVILCARWRTARPPIEA
jgi:hypothetical protein